MISNYAALIFLLVGGLPEPEPLLLASSDYTPHTGEVIALRCFMSYLGDQIFLE